MTLVGLFMFVGTTSFASSTCTLGEIQYDAKQDKLRLTDTKCSDAADSVTYNANEILSAFSTRSSTIKILIDKGYRVKSDNTFIKL